MCIRDRACTVPRRTDNSMSLLATTPGKRLVMPCNSTAYVSVAVGLAEAGRPAGLSVALMLLHDSRRQARTGVDGELVLLEDQDRALWNRQQIDEGCALVERALASRRIGMYTLQAAISAVHALSLIHI